MPQLLTDGLPEKQSHSKFDFSGWADGQAWKFIRSEDYELAAFAAMNEIEVRVREL